MSDIKLFRIAAGAVTELAGTTDTVEKSVQVLFEKNLDALLGVRFLATEYTTSHGGRIDTLGLDENGCPVILEYKRASNENVINQGLFYLDWLMDHRKDFQWLVLEKLGKDAADAVDWSAPRLIPNASKAHHDPRPFCASDLQLLSIRHDVFYHHRSGDVSGNRVVWQLVAPVDHRMADQLADRVSCRDNRRPCRAAFVHDGDTQG